MSSQACLLLTGIVAAIATAPLFDRVFTHHLAVTAKVCVPILACAWLSLIWAGESQYRASSCSVLTDLHIGSQTPQYWWLICYNDTPGGHLNYDVTRGT